MENIEGVEITAIRPDSIFTPGQPPTEGYRVEFTTPGGVHSYVKVPRSSELADTIHEAVMLEAAQLHAAQQRHGMVTTRAVHRRQ